MKDEKREGVRNLFMLSFINICSLKEHEDTRSTKGVLRAPSCLCAFVATTFSRILLRKESL